jgi:hypothetical protein
MSFPVQIVIAVSLSVIAFYFLVLTVISVLVYLKLRRLERYFSTTVKGNLELTLGHLQNIATRLEGLADDTSSKIEDFSQLIPETRDRLQELIDLLDIFQSRIRGPLLNIASIIKVIGDKFSRTD